jgi:hypothetical protein
VSRRQRHAVENRLSHLLRRRAISWGELAQWTFLPARRLRAARASNANPALALADRIAVALDVEVEDLWRLR